MFIIYGTWYSRKDFGPAYLVECNKCGKENFMHLKKMREWSTFFFIPIIPGFMGYALECQICNTAWEIKYSLFKKYKKIVPATELFLAEEIDEEEYMAYVNEVFPN